MASQPAALAQFYSALFSKLKLSGLMFLHSSTCKFTEKLWLILLLEYCIYTGTCNENVYVLFFSVGSNEVFTDVYISDTKTGQKEGDSIHTRSGCQVSRIFTHIKG